MSVTWTPEMLADLANLWTEGLSAREIAIEINQRHGTTISRNSAIGMSHRLQLTKRPSPVIRKTPCAARQPRARDKRKRVEPKPKPQRPKISGLIPEGMHVSEKSAKIERKISDAFLEDPETAMTLEECQKIGNACRWPLGDVISKPRLWCGAPTYVGQSYCPRHSKMAHAGHSEPLKLALKNYR